MIKRWLLTVTSCSVDTDHWLVQVRRPMLGQYQWSVSSVAPWSNIRCQELTILSGVWRQDCKVTFSGQTNYLIRIRDDQRCAGGGKVSAGVCKPANILSSTLTLSLISEASQFILCQRYQRMFPSSTSIRKRNILMILTLIPAHSHQM